MHRLADGWGDGGGDLPLAGLEVGLGRLSVSGVKRHRRKYKQESGDEFHIAAQISTVRHGLGMPDKAQTKGEGMTAKRKSKGAYMISSVAEMYGIHPQTLRMYEREGLLKPSRTDGNTRLYTDEDLERLEFILNLARDLGVNIAGIGIILQMRERMEEMNRQMQSFVDYVRSEMLARVQQATQQATPGLVPLRRPAIIPVEARELSVREMRPREPGKKK